MNSIRIALALLLVGTASFALPCDDAKPAKPKAAKHQTSPRPSSKDGLIPRGGKAAVRGTKHAGSATGHAGKGLYHLFIRK